jgi:hypothetical protein
LTGPAVAHEVAGAAQRYRAPVSSDEVFLGFLSEIDRANGDRRALTRVRLTIRGSRELTAEERVELLEHARYVGGCKPSPVEVSPPSAGQAR